MQTKTHIKKYWQGKVIRELMFYFVDDIRHLSPPENAATNKAKAEGDAKGKQFVPQPKNVAKKVVPFRKNKAP